MNLQDQLHDALLGETTRDRAVCGRCGDSLKELDGWAEAQLAVAGSRAWVSVSSDFLCPACVIDYRWWINTPPEQPSISSDTLLGTTQEVPDGPTTPDRT